MFAPFLSNLDDHLARLTLADLFLDTLPCNAHTTASDALFMGVPVITTPGPTFAGRVAASLLSAVGMPELDRAVAVRLRGARARTRARSDRHCARSRRS